MNAYNLVLKDIVSMMGNGTTTDGQLFQMGKAMFGDHNIVCHGVFPHHTQTIPFLLISGNDFDIFLVYMLHHP